MWVADGCGEGTFRQSAVRVRMLYRSRSRRLRIDLARQVIDSLAGDFDPSELASEYRRDLKALIEAKMRGEEIVAPEPVEVAPVIDLMEALKASVAAAKKRPADEADETPAKPTRARKARSKAS